MTLDDRIKDIEETWNRAQKSESFDYDYYDSFDGIPALCAALRIAVEALYSIRHQAMKPDIANSADGIAQSSLTEITRALGTDK